MTNHNYILTIAGHDPSGGAGVTADIKTFEAHGLYGLSVCTAITVQNDLEFKNCDWVSEELIQSQITTLFKRFKISVVKIGIIKSWSILLAILKTLKKLNADIKIVLDPVMSATAGYDFHISEKQEILDEIWKHCFIITPNYNEIKIVYPNKNVEETIEHISALTNVFLKGGHRTENTGVDELYHSKIVKVTFNPSTTNISEKHGSGCVLSSALASNLALDAELEDACRKAKHYTEHFLNSHASLLGVHTKTTVV